MELRRAGLTTNPRKCHLGLSEAKFLGFQVRQGLIKRKEKEKKVKADRSSPKLSTKSQVRAFLGLAGYYRCFIPNFSSLASRSGGGHPECEDSAHIGAGLASPGLQLPLPAANRCLRHRTWSRPVFFKSVRGHSPPTPCVSPTTAHYSASPRICIHIYILYLFYLPLSKFVLINVIHVHFTVC